MNEQRKCLVGRDDDYGWAIGLAIALFVIAMIGPMSRFSTS